MKCSALLILLSIAVSVLSRATLPASFRCDALEQIGPIDVCNSAAPALASCGSLDCLPEFFCKRCPLAANTIADTHSPSGKQLLIVFREERPPEA